MVGYNSWIDVLNDLLLLAGLAVGLLLLAAGYDWVAYRHGHGSRVLYWAWQLFGPESIAFHWIKRLWSGL